MARTPDPVLKQHLLDQVVGYLADNGLGILSLRPMAAALGMSTNRLVHHFGTKDELIAAALERAVELQADVRNEWLAADAGITQADLLRNWWTWVLAAPRNLALVRLGLEAAALDATVTGLGGEVRAQQIGLWRTNIEQRLVAEGLPEFVAHREASIAKAVFTGLVLDLMASGEVDRLTDALEAYLDRLTFTITEGADSPAVR
jgi:AcrR family transcriptional regulator